ncbi:hypothetical protein ACFTAO_33580 [Paenibacillus rhizoplanae]
MRWMVLCGPNVIGKPTTLRRMVLCWPNVIGKPTTAQHVLAQGERATGAAS